LLKAALPLDIAAATPEICGGLTRAWALWARDEQWPPACDGPTPWTTWLFLGGRGAGKTRAGAEWVRGLVTGHPDMTDQPMSRIALVGETYADVRDVMIEGVSGLMSVHAKSDRPHYETGRRRLIWPNGAIAQVFSAEEPEALRGPQFEAAWCDELAKWRQGEAAFDTLQFSLRLGRRPRQLVTTTPRPIPLLKRLIADPHTVITRAATRDNALNLAPTFLEHVVSRYAGTRLGRQELDGDLIDDRPDAFWRRVDIEAARIATVTPFRRIVVAVDPPAGTGDASICGIVAVGMDDDGGLVVLADHSVAAAQPDVWAARALDLFRSLEADALVVEINQGGAMVASVFASIDASIPVTQVRATRGKRLRAEPVAALYAQGRVRHASPFPALEDEMCAFGADGLANGRSPDRLDALVWAITALTEGRKGQPRVRTLISSCHG
jgi:phage terminase large subunit-like protein